MHRQGDVRGWLQLVLEKVEVGRGRTEGGD